MKILNLIENPFESKSIVFICHVIFFISLTIQANAQTIPATNTGVSCSNCAPVGWYVVTGSTDISDTVGWAGSTFYNWVGTVSNPPNGHTTWVDGYKLEIAGVDITGLTIGDSYDFDFYMAELQSTAGGTVDVNYDGVLEIYNCNTNITLDTFAFSGGPNNAWSLEKLTFTAPSSNLSLCFKYVNSPFSNGNFWNVSFGGNVVNPTCDILNSLAVVNVQCNGDSNGAISATATNGTPPYTYQWSTGSNSPGINGLSAGNYNLTVTDAVGCQEISLITISQPDALQLSMVGAAIPCTGGTASAWASVFGGTPGYSYNWNNGQTTSTATGLTTGTYFITITDNNQCQITDSVTITQSSAVSLAISGTDISCFGEEDGSATVNTTGGTPPFQYTWSNGQTTMTANDLEAGFQIVTVTDAVGCIVVDTVNITEPARISIIFNTSNVGCDSLDDGTTTAINDGGVLPVTYQWDTNTGNQTTTTATNLATGVYKVTLTDANGCIAIGGTTLNAKDCSQPCSVGPCVEVILNNKDICTVLSVEPGNALSTLDCDGDGVTNADECSDNTDPQDPCDYEDSSITLPVTADQTVCPLPCPDLTPIMTIIPGNIAGQSSVDVAIQVTELDSVDTNGSVISVRIPSDPRFAFVWNIGLTMAALVPVQNADWNYLGDNGVVHTWTYNGTGLIIPGQSITAFGFQSLYDPQATDGQTTLTATIIPLSGGDCNPFNNTDSERLVYFQ